MEGTGAVTILQLLCKSKVISEAKLLSVLATELVWCEALWPVCRSPVPSPAPGQPPVLPKGPPQPWFTRGRPVPLCQAPCGWLNPWFCWSGRWCCGSLLIPHPCGVWGRGLALPLNCQQQGSLPVLLRCPWGFAEGNWTGTKQLWGLGLCVHALPRATATLPRPPPGRSHRSGPS